MKGITLQRVKAWLTLPSLVFTVIMVSAVIVLGSSLIPSRAMAPRSISLPTVCQAPLKSPEISWQLPQDLEGNLQQKNLNVVQRAADLFAWQEFIALNWPAKSGVRGVPDQTVNINAVAPRVWETWKETSEVYLPDGREPLPWNAAAPLPPGLGKPLKILYRQSKVDEVLSDEFQPTKADLALPGTLTDQQGRIVRYEIRMNQVAFDYVVQNKLYDANHQAKLEQFNFPNGAILIKAAWREVEPTEEARFHTVSAYVSDRADLTKATYQEIRMGLVGFHIMHKTASAPQWIWSTYEQVDNVRGEQPSFFNPHCPDCLANHQTQAHVPNQVTRLTPIPNQNPDCNQPNQAIDNVAELNKTIQAGLKNSVWQYYELVNTQWPLPKAKIDPTPKTVFQVKPPILANTTMETYIQKTSSCMGCHAIARGVNPNQYTASDFTFTLAYAQPQPAQTQIIPPPAKPVSAWDTEQWNSILRGYQLTTQTYELLPENVPVAKLHCQSCHLNGGGNPKASAWLGMMEKYEYPQTTNLQKRINQCFEHSLNGKPFPITANQPEFRALITYMQWLDEQAQVLDIPRPKTPFPPIPQLTGNSQRGQAIFQQKCSFCHNTDGQGRYQTDTYYRPALWGEQSFNKLAGLHRLNTMAEFIHGNMPYQFDGNLTPQEAWDLATFIDNQERPSGSANSAK
ncbi:c-type cytochrome [Synechococcus sp. PCC 6312]|uniref:c-type cytochrome n=1 Tax=Synechococcus sp. (strain ATCC 27167 / PCC 6312) TaxID=195253 RepID=UPI00029F3EFC|nr:c-type cytochrome [Synechococcus sp. PCC 6312]AFY60473.1 cytochrome c [Synechococcus sp. PCC 6312]